MASGSFGVTTSNQYISGSVTWSESSVDTVNNSSNVYVEMRLSRTNSGYTSYGTDTFRIVVNGTTISNTLSYTLSQNSNTLMVSGTVTVPHNSDGTMTTTISWSGGGGSGGVFTVNSGSGSATLTNIARASTVSSNINWTAGVDNLGITLNVKDSSYHHSVWIYVGDTSNPVVYGNSIGTRDNIGNSYTWVFTQAEITAIYQKINGYENRPVIVRVWTYDSNNNQIGSNQDATGTVNAVNTCVATIPNNAFNIGDSLSATLSPYYTGASGGFTYDVSLTVGSYTKTWSNLTAQANTLTFTSTELNSIYAQIPNDNSTSCTLRTRTKYNGVYTEDGTPASDQVTVTANVVNSNPTFGSTYTYKDTNTTVTAVTGNNQYIVQNQSTLEVDIPTSALATPKNYATMSYYLVTVGNVTQRMDYPATKPTLSLVANSGSTVAATTHYVKYTWVNANGESVPSPEASIAVTTGNNLKVTLPAFPSGVTKANIYISTTAGGEKYQGNTVSTTYTLSTAVTTSGAAVPTQMAFTIGTLNSTANATLTVQAYDSRGNYTTTTKTITILPYSSPVVSTTALRNNGFDNPTTLTLSGSFSRLTISAVDKNSLVTVTYKYKKTTDASYNTATNFTYTTSSGTYSATSVTLTLDNTAAWNVQVVVSDKLTTTTTTMTVSAGSPIMFVDSTKKSVGVGQFPQYNNSFEVSGQTYFNDLQKTNYGSVVTYENIARWYNASSTNIGTIAIVLNPLTNIMFNAEIDLWSYTGTAKYMVGGYTYTSTSNWYCPTATVISNTPSLETPVRFATNPSGLRCILLGTITTNWGGYLQVDIPKVAVGYNGVSEQANWSISLITSETGYSNITSYVPTSFGMASPPGTITMYGGSTVPNGYLLCNGQAVSRTSYGWLYAAIGTNYGAGDGSTTFNLPNIQGRVPVGYNSGDANFNALGKTGGESTHTLTTTEMPSHSHNVKFGGALMSMSSGSTGNYLLTGWGTGGGITQVTEDAAGGGGAHNNLQPYITLNFIIKY